MMTLDDDREVVDYRRGPGTRRDQQPADDEVDGATVWFDDTDEINAVECQECDAPAGIACRNTVTGQPLTKFPAHPRRMLEAAKRKGEAL